MDRLITKTPKVVLSPLRIPITRSIHLPLNYRQFLFSKPTVKISLLRTSFIGGTMRLGSSSQRNLAPCNRYPTINKCNSRKCLCCKFLNMSSLFFHRLITANFRLILNPKSYEILCMWFMLFLEMYPVVVRNTLGRLVDHLKHVLGNIFFKLKITINFITSFTSTLIKQVIA